MRYRPFITKASIAFLFFYLLVSCQGNNDTNFKEPESEIENLPTKEDTIETYLAIVSNLRIRKIPDTDGDILGTMNYGQKAIFLGEESDFKEKIELRGKMRYDSWKKIKTDVYNSSESITGWVYGGGLINESEVYQPNGQNFIREVIQVTDEELSEILGIKVEEEYYYSGTIEYNKVTDGTFKKEGKMSLKGVKNLEISDQYTHEISIEITGSYKNDLPDGVFEMKYNGYENSNVATINFENGNCLWASIMGSSEGTDYSHREENPSECTFSFIQKKLLESYQ